ncbi:hypothetical protein ACH518_06830 [Methylomonas sp. HW2-6]|uniref:hypothetical protein n=1 Tax=Methylomonas sp. HW2-6 TaxID=3376687 RepID=UPI0040416CDE
MSFPIFQIRPLPWAVAAVLAGGSLAAVPAAAAARYDFAGTGLQGDRNSVARDINDQGQILLLNNLPGKDREPSVTRSYIYRNGSAEEITVGGKSVQAYAINNRGDVVASVNVDADHPYTNQLFIRRDGANEMTGLSTDSRKGVSWAINDHGDIAGTLIGGERAEGVIYRNGTLLKTGGAGASAINNRGDAAGYVAGPGGLGSVAHLYRDGVGQAIGGLGGYSGQGLAINAGGEVVGYSSLSPDEYLLHAFHYANGRMQDLGSLGGDSRASDINDTSQIVGYSRTTDNAMHAVLWNNGRIYDLNRLAADGWTLHHALGINRYGQIVGFGSHEGAEAEGFVLTLHPEWQGNGNGAWDDAARWNYAGFGSFGFAPGQPHDVVVNPGGNATILGSAHASVRSLVVSGSAGQSVAFDLNRGYTAAERGTRLQNAALTGAGTLDGGLQIDAASRVQVGSGEQMRLVGGSVDNAGRIQLIGASGNLARLHTDRMLINQGQLQLQNAAADFAGGLENRGQLQVGFGANSVTGAVTNAKTGRIVLSGNGETAFWGDVTLQSGSELRVGRDAGAVFFGQVVVRDGALLSGTGTSYYEGGLSLGNSPALVANSGSASFGSENLYLAEIGGLEAGQQFDQLQVAGNLNFGGVLQLMWWDNFAAQAGDVFDLFDWGSSSGKFTRIDTRFATLANGLRWDFSKLYTTGEIGVAAVPLPGAFWLFGSALLALAGRRRNA